MTATLSLTLLFFLINRLRQRKTQVREIRQTIDDQRSMGSIGYIGGNLGYIGPGTLNMDYSYDHGPAHYHLWKPPGSYFTRGEAPPPYEEAIALAQAEPLNSCTVSVATSTQRQYPISMTESNAAQTISANTTNLINININNGGNVTTIASGENHATRNEIESSVPTDIGIPNVNMTNRNNLDNEPRVSLSANYYTIPVVNSEVCTNRHCDLNYNSNDNYSDSDKNANIKEVQTCSNQILPIVPRVIPPKGGSSDRLFNCEVSINRTSSLENTAKKSSTARNDISTTDKIRNSDKRYHRTIPRQFAAVDPIINPLKNNHNLVAVANNAVCANELNSKIIEHADPLYDGLKRLSCQCPVQHMSMPYSSPHIINVNHNSVGESSSVVSHEVNVQNISAARKKKNIPRSRHDNVSQSDASLQQELSQISKNDQCRGTHRKIYDSGEKNTLGYTMTQPTSDVERKLDDRSSSDNKITLKKDISGPSRTSITKGTNGNQIFVPKCIVVKADQDCHTAGYESDKHTTNIKSNFDKDTLRKPIISSNLGIQSNPELPPKLLKHNGRSSGTQRSYYGSSRTYTISKPSQDNAKFSIPANSNLSFSRINTDLQKTNYSRSLPRNALSGCHDYVQISKYATRQSCVSKNIDDSNTNTNYNTLPKKGSKLTTRNSNLLTEVVNKVPSVINIPSPIQSTSRCVVIPGGEVALSQSSSIKLINKRSQLSAFNTLQPTEMDISKHHVKNEKPLPVLTTSTNCSNPKEHFLPNDNSLDDDYLSECENCKSAHGSRYYLEGEIDDVPQETMTLQRKMPDSEEDQQNYYRVSSTLPIHTSKRAPALKNRETWFSTIPASSSSDEEDPIE